MKVALGEIRHLKSGFQALVSLQRQTSSLLFKTIDIDMADTTWFDADMCAAFGAILYKMGANGNTVKLVNILPDVERVLSKNGFLSHYGRNQVPDTWGTTIAYRRFDTKDDRYFASYMEDELIRRSEIPTMTPGLMKKFRESIFEVFSNAVIHSRTRLGIFSCGQYFPKRNRLDFSVADLGIGMRRNVNEHVGLELTAESAIDWTTKNHNTTKSGPVPGGLGLKLLREFIDLNGGSMQIVSDSGYWRRAQGQTQLARLTHPFPGTVVTLEINTADSKSYALTSELDPNSIF